MNGKYPPKRRDGKTNFRELSEYIADAEKTHGAIRIGNLFSIETAAEEMTATAHGAPRVRDPALHFLLSWPEDEYPTDEQALAAGLMALQRLGFDLRPGGHQFLMAVHHDTGNVHTHIGANRVHPVTLEPLHLEWSDRTLSIACREIEIAQGWKHDNGLAVVVEVDGIKRVIDRPAMPERPSEKAGPTSQAAKDFEAHTGEVSFERYLKEQVAGAAKAALKSGSWQQLHQVLDCHGVELVQHGGGLAFRDRERPEIHAAASSAGSWAKSAALVKKLGDFRPPAERHPATKVYESTAPKGVRNIGREQAEQRKAERDQAARGRSPGRKRYQDPTANQVEIRQREQEREALYARYREEQRQGYAIHRRERERARAVQRDSEQRRRDELRVQRKESAATVWQGWRETPPAERIAPSALIAILALESARHREHLDAEIRAERQALRERFAGGPPKQSWRQWLRAQPESDAPAQRALRCLRLRERDAQEPDQPPQLHPGDPSPFERRQPEAFASLLDELELVSRGSALIYHDAARDIDVAIDQGDRLDVLDRSDESIEQSLRIAAARWGEVHITGDREFRQRAAEIAGRIGIRVGNEELQEIHQAARRAAQTTSAPPARQETSHVRPRTPIRYFEHAPGEPNARPAQPLARHRLHPLSECRLAHDGEKGESADLLPTDARPDRRVVDRLRRSAGRDPADVTPPTPPRLSPEELEHARRVDLVALAEASGWERVTDLGSTDPAQVRVQRGGEERVIALGEARDMWVPVGEVSGKGGDAVAWQRAEGMEFRAAVEALAEHREVDQAERGELLRGMEVAEVETALDDRQAASQSRELSMGHEEGDGMALGM